MAYSRNEYLQSLNRMRANYQSQGNPLVNREDDNGNVGNELSAFAYMQTDTPAPEQASKGERNGWQRTVDTVHSGISNITEGVTNFIDDVWDFAVVSTSWLTGLFSGIGSAIQGKGFEEGWKQGTEWTQPATTFEWEQYLNQWWNQMDLGHAVLTGDMFNGEWGQKWAEMGDAEKTKQNVAETHQNSWANEWGDFGQGIQKVEQGVGYVLPSIVLAYFTGGASLGAQVAIQAGVAGASAMGGGFEQATKEGASYEKAMGYGATKGAISAGTTALTYWIGGNAVKSVGGSVVSNLGKKAGSEALKITGSKTAEVVVGKAVEITAQAGISGARAYAMAMADPALKTIYNDKSIAESYSGENLTQTLELAKQSALTAMATSAVVGSLREGVDYARYGKDGYMLKYYNEKSTMLAKSDAKKIKNASVEKQSAEAKLSKQLKSGKISEEEYNAKMSEVQTDFEKKVATIRNDIENKTLKAIQTAQEYAEKIEQNSGKTAELGSEELRTKQREFKKKYHPDTGEYSNEVSAEFNSKYKELLSLKDKGLADGQLNTERLEILNKIQNPEVKKDLSTLFPTSHYGNNEKVIKSFYEIKNNYQAFASANGVKWYENKDGTVTATNNDTSVTFDDSGKPFLLTYKGDTIEVKGGDGGKFLPVVTKDNIGQVLSVISNTSIEALPVETAIKPSVLNVPSVEAKGVNTNLPFKISKEITSKIMNKSNSKEILNFLETGFKGHGKDNYVYKIEDGKYYVVEPYKDGDVIKYGIVAINSKTNEIIDISVKSSRPSIDKAYIVPKMDEKKLLSTKLENKDGTAIVYDVDNVDFDYDISDTGKEFSINAKQSVNRGMNEGGFVYSKNPLRVADYKKEIPFARLSKVFEIPASLEKTYNLKVSDSKNELSVLKWVGRREGMSVEQVLNKLGYDSIVKSDNSVTFFKAGNILRRGVEFKYGKSRQDYSDLIKRNVSADTSRKLDEYVGQNGKELVTQKDGFEYSKLIRETLSYSINKVSYGNEEYEVKLISKSKYTPDMLRAVERSNKIGIKTRFALRMQETKFADKLSKVSAYWSGNSTKITIFTDSGRRGTLEQTCKHEFAHGVLDKLHGWELLDCNAKIDYLEKNYPLEVLKKRELYTAQWDNYDPSSPTYNQQIYEEMFADTYAGLCEWEDKEFQNSLIKEIDALVDKGTKVANREYYQLLAKQEAEDRALEYAETDNTEKYDGRTTINTDPKKAGELEVYKETADEAKKLISILKQSPKPILEDEKNPIQYATVAPLYKSDAKTQEDFEALSTGVMDKFIKRCAYIAKITGCRYEPYKGRGIYTNDDNYRLREPSVLSVLGHVSAENANLAGSLMGERGYQQQENVIVFNYEKKSDWNKLDQFNKAIAYEMPIDEKNAFAITNKFHEGGIDATVLDNKILFLKSCVFDLGDGNDFIPQKMKDFEASLEKLCNNLIEEGLINGNPKEIIKKSYVNERYLGATDRKNIYLQNSRAYASQETSKVISDVKRQSSTVLIEAGADVSKATKVRLNNVKQAFVNALEEVTPNNATYHIAFEDVKSSYAELNLAKPKDYNIAIDNMMKYLGRAKVTFVLSTGNETAKLSDLLTQAQMDEARSIMLDTIKGKAEPTKLAKWAKSLTLERLEKYETRRNVVLMNKLQRRIASSKKLNFGYGNAPTAELSVYENIIKDLPRFWDNNGVIQFANNVMANYNESNLKELFDQYGIVFDENIYEVARNLKDKVVPGQHLSPLVQAEANDLLQLIYNNLETVDAKIKSENVKQAERDANIVQSMYFSKNHNNKVAGVIKNTLGSVDTSITSPIDFFNRRIAGTELQRFVNEDTGIYENRELDYKSKYKKLIGSVFNKKITALMKKKFTFKGEKISYGVALDRLNTYMTLGDKFFNSKGTKTNFDKTRSEIIYTPEDVAELEKRIPSELLDANIEVLKILNGDLKKDIAKLYKECTHTDLRMLDENNIWYNVSRVSDSYGGISMGGTSFRDMNLSFLNKRVNSRADLNFNLDLATHIESYINTAFKKLVWQPYVNKLNTLLNTRVYGVTNYKIYQENVPDFDKELDLLFHEVMGIPFERKVSTVSSVAGKVVGNLNAVRVSTIQTGLRTISSAPFFAKYFGAKVAVKGVAREVMNGSFFALGKNYKIITKYSPYFKNRFTSEEVLLAETGLSAINKVSKKIFGIPLRFGDAYVHLSLGFAMAQVKAQEEGYGKPYTDSNNERAVKLLEQASKSTQPTNAVGRVAGFRYGQSVFKYMFGLYGSMKQAFYDGLVAPLEDALTYKSKLNSIENAIKNHEIKIEEYSRKAKEFEIKMDEATDDETFKEAEKNYEKYSEKAKSHKKAKENSEEFAKEFKSNHTARKNLNRIAGSIGGLLFASLAYVAINNAIKIWEGKKSIKDITIQDIGVDTLEQSFINSMPYLSTIYASIKNNSDLSIATVDNLNRTIDAVKSFVEAVESANGGKITGSALKIIEEVANYLGIPLQSFLKLVNGTWYNIDKESNLSARNWLGMLSATTLRNNYNDAVKKGDEDRAKANLQVWLYEYSVPSSGEVIDEIYRLNAEGYTNVAPSARATSYTDENGTTVKFTSNQTSLYAREYGKADKDVSELLKADGYNALNGETKASTIKKIYTTYNEYAKARALGVAPNSKLAKLLYYTNGDINLAKYILSIQQLSVIKADEKNSRKDNVITEINKMSGLNKNEKLLLAYLSGYSVSEKNQQRMVSFLVSKGFAKKDAKEFIK